MNTDSDGIAWFSPGEERADAGGESVLLGAVARPLSGREVQGAGIPGAHNLFRQEADLPIGVLTGLTDDGECFNLAHSPGRHDETNRCSDHAGGS